MKSIFLIGLGAVISMDWCIRSNDFDHLVTHPCRPACFGFCFIMTGTGGFSEF